MIFRSDNAIRSETEARLRASAEICETDITVKVVAGVLTLSGYVRRLADKSCAERLAKTVPGVVALANDITILPTAFTRVSDPELARGVVVALRHALPLSWERIRPIVRSGVVTLEGRLAHDRERTRAQAAVGAVHGVEAVTNLITTSATATPERCEAGTDTKASSVPTVRTPGESDRGTESTPGGRKCDAEAD